MASVDHIAEALNRLPEQFRSDPNVTALLSSLVGPCQALETALQDMLTKRGVDTAVGAQLDIVGKLVGQSRNGLDDETFRRYIRARISAHRSSGVVEDLIRITTLVLNDLGATLIVDQQGVAAVVVRIEDTTVDATVADAIISFLRIAGAAGVRVILESSTVVPAEAFAFDVLSGHEGDGFTDPGDVDRLQINTTNCQTGIAATVPGVSGLTFALVATGTGGGQLTRVGNAVTFAFQPGVTTVNNLQLAISLTDYLQVEIFDLGVLESPGDVMSATPLTGGYAAITGGSFIDARI